MAQTLVVEDQSLIAKDIQASLISNGYDVPVTARTSEEALQKLEENKPDLVLMDVRLGAGMDGVEAANRIRERHRIPVIYLTAYADPQILRRAKLTEPHGYILKPFNERELCSTIELALYRARIEDQLKQNRAWLAAVLKSLGEAVIVTDENGLITYLNPVAERLTGWCLQEALCESLSSVFNIRSDANDAPQHHPVIDALEGGGGGGLSKNTLLRSKDGSEIPVSGSISAVKDGSGRVMGAVMVFRDVIRHREAEKKLEAARSLLETTLDSTADGILVVDRDGHIVQYNRKFIEMWRIPESAIRSKSDQAAIRLVLDQLKDPQSFFARIQSVYSQPAAESTDILEFKDGRFFERESKPQLLRGEVIGRVWSFRDITESKRSNERLEQANRQLEQANRSKSEMTAMVSHELKTPLTALNESIALILDELEGPVTGGQRQMLHLAQRNINRLNRLVGDILEFSKFEAAKMHIAMAETDLTSLCIDIYRFMKLATAKKGIHFSYNLPRARLCVLCDGDKIRQVLINLIDNAIKFTEKGQKIRLSLRQSKEEAVIELMDTGRGIPKAHQCKIFRIFEQASRRGNDGSGLGLAVCKRIMDEHGGRISVESEPGAGSKFTVILPALPA